MKVLFAGSPGIAIPCLNALSNMEMKGEDLQLAAVLTNSDSPQGRKGELVPTEVSVAAGVLSLLREERGFPPLIQFRFDKLDTSLLPNNYQCKTTDMWFEDMGHLRHG